MPKIEKLTNLKTKNVLKRDFDKGVKCPFCEKIDKKYLKKPVNTSFV